MSGLLNSASAISAALRMEVAATAALPLPDSGRIRPTLTLPSPMLLAGAAGVLDDEPGIRSPTEMPVVQPASRAAESSAPSHARLGNQGILASNTRSILAGLLGDDR